MRAQVRTGLQHQNKNDNKTKKQPPFSVDFPKQLTIRNWYFFKSPTLKDSTYKREK